MLPARARDRLVALALVVSVAAVSGWSVWVKWSEHPGDAAARFLVGPFFMVTALLLSRQAGQRTNSWLVGSASVAWSLAQLKFPSAGYLTSVAYFAGTFAPILICAALLGYPSRRPLRSHRLFVTVNIVIALVLTPLVIVTMRPQWQGFHPGPWPTLWPNQALNRQLHRVREVWWSLAGVAFIVLFAQASRAMRGLGRQLQTPILWAAVVAALGFVIAPLDQVFHGSADGLDLFRSAAATVLSASFLWSALQLRLTYSGVAHLATQLASRPGLSTVEGALRQALCDDDLRVLFWLPESSSFVDSQGAPVEPPEDGERAYVVEARSSTGSLLAKLVVEPGLRRYDDLVAAAVAVSRLALENALLEAGLLAQLVAVREARARLLRSGLEQRRQIERDLHDGAQQRLLAVAVRLGAIEVGADSDTAAGIQIARKELHLALEELRDLAHGVYPAILTQAGLGAAVEAVAERLAITVTLDVPDLRWPSDVEGAAYLVACEALTNTAKHAGPCEVSVHVRGGADVVVEIRDNGVGNVALGGDSALPSLRDRVEALGGQLDVRSGPESGTVVLARIPCV